MVGVEAAEQGELLDAETVIIGLQEKLQKRHSEANWWAIFAELHQQQAEMFMDYLAQRGTIETTEHFLEKIDTKLKILD